MRKDKEKIFHDFAKVIETDISEGKSFTIIFLLFYGFGSVYGGVIDGFNRLA